MLRSTVDLLRRIGMRRAARDPGGLAEAHVPDGSLICAIGDIHGRVDLLRDLELRLVRFAEGRSDKRRVLVYLGDYVDRGGQSSAVIDHLLASPPDGFERIFLTGNHEEFVLRFLESPADGSVWLNNGGRETLLSYGVALPAGMPSPDDIGRVREDLVTRLPRSHLAFLRSLALTHVEGDYLFVHAGIRPGVKLTDQRPDDLLWIRGAFLDSTVDHGHIVVHGHTVSDEPDVRHNRIGIDTGAYATGRLTALILSGAERQFVQT